MVRNEAHEKKKAVKEVNDSGGFAFCCRERKEGEEKREELPEKRFLSILLLCLE